jgi:hypothetical protein
MVECDARRVAAEALMTEARIRAVKFRKQAIQRKHEMDKLLNLPKADVYALWPTLRKLTRELGVDAATSRALVIMSPYPILRPVKVESGRRLYPMTDSIVHVTGHRQDLSTRVPQGR